eukprot:tig00001128_g7198.t1
MGWCRDCGRFVYAADVRAHVAICSAAVKKAKDESLLFEARASRTSSESRPSLARPASAPRSSSFSRSGSASSSASDVIAASPRRLDAYGAAYVYAGSANAASSTYGRARAVTPGASRPSYSAAEEAAESSPATAARPSSARSIQASLQLLSEQRFEQQPAPVAREAPRSVPVQRSQSPAAAGGSLGAARDSERDSGDRFDESRPGASSARPADQPSFSIPVPVPSAVQERLRQTPQRLSAQAATSHHLPSGPLHSVLLSPSSSRGAPAPAPPAPASPLAARSSDRYSAAPYAPRDPLAGLDYLRDPFRASAAARPPSPAPASAPAPARPPSPAPTPAPPYARSSCPAFAPAPTLAPSTRLHSPDAPPASPALTPSRTAARPPSPAPARPLSPAPSPVPDAGPSSLPGLPACSPGAGAAGGAGVAEVGEEEGEEAPRCYEFAESRLDFRTVTLAYEDPSLANEERVAAVAAVGTFGPDPALHWAREVPLAAIPSARRVLWRVRVDLPLRRVEFRFRVRYEGAREPVPRLSRAHEIKSSDRRTADRNCVEVYYERHALPRRRLYRSAKEAPARAAMERRWSLVACLAAARELLSAAPAGPPPDCAAALAAVRVPAAPSLQSPVPPDASGPAGIEAAAAMAKQAGVGAALLGLEDEAATLRALPSLAPLAAGEPLLDVLGPQIGPADLENLAGALEGGGRRAGRLRAIVASLVEHSVLVAWGGPLPAGRPLLLDPLPRPDEINGEGLLEAPRGAAALEFEGAAALRAYLSRELFGARVAGESRSELNSVLRFCELALGPAPAPPPAGAAPPAPLRLEEPGPSDRALGDRPCQPPLAPGAPAGSGPGDPRLATRSHGAQEGERGRGPPGMAGSRDAGPAPAQGPPAEESDELRALRRERDDVERCVAALRADLAALRADNDQRERSLGQRHGQLQHRSSLEAP